MDAIKAIADGIRAERKAAAEASTEATAADVVQAVAPKAEEAPKQTPEPAEDESAGEPIEESKE